MNTLNTFESNEWNYDVCVAHILAQSTTLGFECCYCSIYSAFRLCYTYTSKWYTIGWSTTGGKYLLDTLNPDGMSSCISDCQLSLVRQASFCWGQSPPAGFRAAVMAYLTVHLLLRFPPRALQVVLLKSSSTHSLRRWTGTACWDRKLSSSLTWSQKKTPVILTVSWPRSIPGKCGIQVESLKVCRNGSSDW